MFQVIVAVNVRWNPYEPLLMNNEVKTSNAFKDDILREQIKFVMEHVPTMQAGSFVVALVLCYVVRGIVAPASILIWVLLVFLIVLSRVVLYYRFGKVREKPFGGKYWKNLYLSLTLISGIIWGASAFIIFPAGNLGLAILFVLVMAGLSADATVSHSSIRLGPVAWAGPAMIPYAIRCFVDGSEFGYTSSLLIILYLFVIIRFSFIHNRSISSAVTLRFENLELFSEVQRVNDALRQDIAKRIQAEEALRNSHSLLAATLESTADGILVVDTLGRVSSFNRNFLELWRIPETLIATRDDGQLLQFVLDQVLNPDAFLDKIRALYQTPDASSMDELVFKDGRIFERYSQPQRIDDAIVGRVWSFRDVTERKRADKALQESEDRLRTFLHTVNEGFWLIDNDTVTMDLNPKMSIIMGRDRDEALGRKIFDFVDNENRAIFEHQVRLRAQGQLGAYEIAISRPDGSHVFCQFNVTPLFDRSGNKVGAFAMVTDITERKQAEEALLESENKFKSFAEQSIAGINIIQDGVFKYVNPKFAEMFGYTVEECLNNMPFKNMIHEKDLASVEEHVGRRTSGEPDSGHYTCRGLKKNGQIFHVEIYGSSIVYKGKPAATGTVLDITERKRAENALEESEEKYRRIVETANEGICMTDVDNLVTYVNQKLADMLGYLPEEIIGRPLVHFLFPKDLADHQEKWSHRLHGLSETYERRFRRSDGGECWTIVSVTVIRAEDGRFTGAFGMLTDITERKQAEKETKNLAQQLFQAQKMESVGRLAGGVAHDFNNMLGVIIGRAEMALNMDVSVDQLQHHLKEILKAGLRSADLTRQLLAFARKQTAILQILDLNGTISDMLNMLRRLIGEDIGLSLQPGVDLWKVKIDPSQVDQILANLVVNARDAISGVGAITLGTGNVVIDDSNRAETPEFTPGEYVLLTVSDTGAGMSQEVRENIFEPFFTTKEVGKGTGLGLSTVYGIVKQNDGFVYVASEPGKGTTFKIYLPRCEAETAQAASDEVAGKRPTGTETVLLVEDDEAILNLSKMILENLGYTVLATQTPVHAIHIVKEHPGDIHLLITDVVMPEMNGRELGEELRAFLPNLKCLYMSGYTADLIAHRGVLDAGVNFIQKPFLGDDFAARVRQVLDHLE